MRKGRSLRMSRPEPRELHGVLIRKLPMGKWLEFSERLQDVPELLMECVFPGQSFAKVLESLAILKSEDAAALLGNLLATAPRKLCELIAPLLDIPEERLTDPDAGNGLGLCELLEVLTAFVEANDLTDFFPLARGLLKRRGQSIGSSAG